MTEDLIRRPWRIDQDNESGIVVVNDAGDCVHECYYEGIPTERGPSFFEQMVKCERAWAHEIVEAINRK